MKKILIVSGLFTALIVTVFIIGCSNNKSNTGSNGNTNSITSNTNKTFTVDDLKKYDGQNGNPAYVAVDGKVYDVTNAKKWKSGKHENGVVAGVDLTSTFSNAPHGKEVLNGLTMVGTLK